MKTPGSFGSGLQVDWTDGDLASNLILNRFDDGYMAGFPDGSKPDGILWLKMGGKATPIVFPQPVTLVVADSAQHVSSRDNDVVVVHEDNPNASLTWAFYRTTRLKCGPDFLTRSNGSAHLHL